MMALSCAIALTVIVATGRAYIDGVSKAQEDLYFRTNGKPNPVYSKDADCIVSVVFIWPGMIACFARYLSVYFWILSLFRPDCCEEILTEVLQYICNVEINRT